VESRPRKERASCCPPTPWPTKAVSVSAVGRRSPVAGLQPAGDGALECVVSDDALVLRRGRHPPPAQAWPANNDRAVKALRSHLPVGGADAGSVRCSLGLDSPPRRGRSPVSGSTVSSQVDGGVKLSVKVVVEVVGAACAHDDLAACRTVRGSRQTVVVTCPSSGRVATRRRGLAVPEPTRAQARIGGRPRPRPPEGLGLPSAYPAVSVSMSALRPWLPTDTQPDADQHATSYSDMSPPAGRPGASTSDQGPLAGPVTRAGTR
jgi:hypothetical protein